MHYSVLLNESIEGLNLKEDSVVVDCTLGYGGHSSEILKKITRGYLFAFDADEEAITSSSLVLSKIRNNFEIIHSNFKNIKEELNSRGITKVDAIMYDLGVSSPQLDEDYRGFSFHNDGPLDMRMDTSSNFSAYNVVNEYSYNDLVRILRDYGEEKYANSIAKNIIKNRPITRTLELAEIIKNSYPERERREHHPARKSFQAIRIEVNHELDVLEESLHDALDLLSVGGRICVITFHSLEDRIVKNIFKSVTEEDPILKGVPNVPLDKLPDFKLINKSVILPSDIELVENNRSRSAKLRIIERIK